MNLPLLSIRIGIDPVLFEVGTFVLTWHGFLTFISVALAVFLVGRWAKRDGMNTDAVYSVATWCIIGGIIGTRVFHVIDLWNDVYSQDPVQIVRIWEGGITIYGAILGGFVGGATYIVIRNHPTFLRIWNAAASLLPRIISSTILGLPKGAKLERAPLPSVGRLADIAAPAMLLAMAVGRIGDIFNGEHVAKLTNLPWGFVYTHPESPSNLSHGLQSSHPAVVYELLLDLAILALIWPLRNRLRPYGMTFALYLAAYSLGKFFVSFLRTGSFPMDRVWAIGMGEAQYVAIVVLAITVPLLLLKAQVVREPVPARAPSPGARRKR